MKKKIVKKQTIKKVVGKKQATKKVTGKKAEKKVIVVDGKVEDSSKRDIVDILADKKSLNYSKNQSKEQYEKEIGEMNTTELHRHAIEHGLIPIENRKVLIARLEREFARDKLKMTSSQSAPALEGDDAEKFLRIMNGKKV